MITWIDHFVEKRITPIPSKKELDFQYKKDGDTYYIKEVQLTIP